MIHRRAMWSVLLDLFVVLFAAAGAGFYVYTVLAAPLGGPRVVPYLAIWAGTALPVHRLGAFAQRRIAGKWLRRGAGVGKWLLAVMAPLFAIAALESMVIARQMDTVKHESEPLRRHARAGLSSADRAPAGIRSALSDRSALWRVEYLTSAGRFRLKTQAGTIDIDGRTIGRDSQGDAWWHRHNDIVDGSPTAKFDRSESCERRNANWVCFARTCAGGCDG